MLERTHKELSLYVEKREYIHRKRHLKHMLMMHYLLSFLKLVKLRTITTHKTRSKQEKHKYEELCLNMKS